MVDTEKDNGEIDEFESIVMSSALEPAFGPRQTALIDGITHRNQHGPELTEADKKTIEFLFEILYASST